MVILVTYIKPFSFPFILQHKQNVACNLTLVKQIAHLLQVARLSWGKQANDETDESDEESIEPPSYKCWDEKCIKGIEMWSAALLWWL